MPKKALEQEAIKYPRRTNRKIKTRANIVLAANQLFKEQGYKDTTMHAIADRADVHVTTVFNHFASKADIISELVDSSLSEINEDIQKQKDSTSFFDFMRDEITLGANLQKENINAYDPVYGNNESLFLWDDPSATLAWIQYEVKKAQLLADYFAHEYGLDRATDIRADLVAGMLVTGTIESFQRWRRSPDTIDLNTESRKVVDQVERFVKGEGISKKAKKTTKKK